VKSYSSAGQAVILLALIPLYGAFASRVNRKRLITVTMLFFMSHLAVFYVLGSRGVREGIVYFLWVGVFNVFRDLAVLGVRERSIHRVAR
jgi:AAA family ATP:ADP antiporter